MAHGRARAGGRPRFGPLCPRSSRQSSVKAVDTSMGSGRQHPLSVALAAGARRSTSCCAAGSTPARSTPGDRMSLVGRVRVVDTHATSPGPRCCPFPRRGNVLSSPASRRSCGRTSLHTEELLERGYLDARVVLDRVEAQMAELEGTRLATRWWSRTAGRPPLTRKRTRADRSS